MSVRLLGGEQAEKKCNFFSMREIGCRSGFGAGKAGFNKNLFQLNLVIIYGWLSLQPELKKTEISS